MMMHIRKPRGFTLIELLVAIGILAIVAVLGWRGLDAIVRARVSLNDDLEQTRGLQLAFAQMQSDCQNIVDTSSIGGRLVMASQPGTLNLVRTVYGDNQPTRVEVVTYRVRDGVLTRSESVPTRDLATLDAAWSAALGDTDTSQRVQLKTGVEALTMRSWITNGTMWRNGTDTTASTTVAGQTTTSNTGTTTATTTSTTPNTSATAAAATTPLIGLEVSLTLHDRPGKLLKVFLLGAT
jgi:general secretion pathway protein J